MKPTLRLRAGHLGNDLGMALLVVAIVALMVLPLPTVAIDSLLALNMSISILLLMTTLFIPNAIALSSFPSLLLFTTLFRLSLNIASTKAILLHADAGHVIETFGELVVGGNLVVGLVVFVIITLVQFIVISKGSERVAEVGARFTLDAMPGKQMSIDADLRAGIINGDEAKRKRAMLAMESQMHGGMDGAMKFIKGDAIAGLVITLVNILAGVVVGVLYHSMTAAEAANRFAILSVGDAMVSQIPSLFICVAAGVLITRVADEATQRPRSLGQEIFEQLSANARALYLAAALVLAFALIPGFPKIQFGVLALLLALAGRALSMRNADRTPSSTGAPMPSIGRESAPAEGLGILSKPPAFAKPLAIRTSPDLAALLKADELDTAIAHERELLQSRLGLPFPGVAVWIDSGLAPGQFDVLLNDVPVRSATLPGRMLWLKDPDSPLAAHAHAHGPVLDQARSLWLAPDSVPAPQRSQCLTLEAVMARQLFTVLRVNAHAFMGIQEIQWVLEKAGGEYPGLVAEVQKILPLQRMAEVFRRLLEEQVSIRNLRSILESLITWSPKEKDVLMLTEYVRCDLGRHLAFEASAGQGHLQAITLDPGIEQSIRSCIKPTPAGNYLAMPPEDALALTEKILAVAGSETVPGMALVASMDIRRYVRKMIEARMEWLQVYSYQELGNWLELRPVGRVG